MGKLTTEEFVRRAKEVHGDEYDYSKIEYANNHTKVCIICPIHGEFWQTPYRHTVEKRGCPNCSRKAKGVSQRMSCNTFIKRAKEVHNDKYDYSETKYTTSQNGSKVKIICPTHGAFYQHPQSHLNGHGCPKCFSDGNRSLLYNHGIVDSCGYSHCKPCKSFVVWRAMISRCYNKKYHAQRRTYKDCVVCEEWLRYSNFKKWFDDNYIDGGHLDKDVIAEGNRTYSPGTCCFIPNRLNALFKKESMYSQGKNSKIINGKEVYYVYWWDEKRKRHCRFVDDFKLAIKENIMNRCNRILNMSKECFTNKEINADTYDSINKRMFNQLNNVDISVEEIYNKYSYLQ